jgi:hypothetical protein
MKSFFRTLLPLTLASTLVPCAPACDSCTLFVADAADQRGFSLSLAEQYTRFGSVWNGSAHLGNPVDQYLNSLITQLTLGYAPRAAWTVQFTVPYITRSYVRPEHDLIERGRVTGLGDATFAGRYNLYHHASGERTLAAGLVAGVEFGTGNADHLGDELGHHFHHHANFPDSGIHGHDLALGSGSTDYLLGADASWHEGRNFVRAAIQYKARRPGKFGYRLADETAWEAGVGRDVPIQSGTAVAAQVLLSAEHKGFDTLAGEAQVDTGFSAHYVGGRLTATFGPRWSAEASCEIPVRIRTSETMVVPDYRVRTALSWRL